MSTSANIFVLFQGEPSPVRLASLEEMIANRLGRPVEAATSTYNRMVAVLDADLNADAGEDGHLHFLGRERSSKPPGQPSIDGRLFQISYLTRWWDDGYAEGPVMDYSLTMLCLLAQSDVAGVWYTPDNYSDGMRCPGMTRERVHALIDSFVGIGEMSSGKPTRFIRTECGSVIEE